MINWIADKLDRTIGVVSPEWQCKRTAWRRIGQYYEAAKIDRDSIDWIPQNERAEATNQGSRDFIRAKARDKERNSDILNAPLSSRERNIIGTGFRVQAMLEDEETNTKIEKLFAKWQRKQNCDITGEQSLWELTKMALRRSYVDGGIFFVKTYNGNPQYPLQLQAREVDDLDNTIQEYSGRAVIDGIEVDQYQKVIAYHFKVFSPQGWLTNETERIEANRVIRLWDKTRPTQIREISPLAPSLKRINEIDEYMRTISIKEKVLASIAVFIKRAIPSFPYGGTFHVTDRKEKYPSLNLYPGMVKDLQAGDDISTVIPNGQAANAKEFITIHQRLFGSGQGLSHEATSRDLSEVNYSSARQGLLEDQKTYADRQIWLIEHFLTEVYEEFIKSAVLAGTLKIPDFWSNQEFYLNHRWIGPGWSWIDPIKEVNANKISVESGQDNLTNICARQGLDYREVRRQRTKERFEDIEQQAREMAYVKKMEEKYNVSFSVKEKGKKDDKKKQETA